MQVLVYVQRKRISDWKRLVITGDQIQFIYGSNDDRVFPKLARNSVLWVVAAVTKQPPQLVAKLVIDSVFHRNTSICDVDSELLYHFREFKWIAKGSNESKFFGFNNAGNSILNTKFINSSGEVWSFLDRSPVWISQFGRSLQRPVKIFDYSDSKDTNPMEELSDRLKLAIFISWKWKDHKKSEIISLANYLTTSGFMVWIDLFALPASRALKKVQTDSIKLERLLTYGYSNCRYLLALDSENYALQSLKSEKNWTLREWNGEVSPASNLIRICVKSDNKEESKYYSSADFQINFNNPEEIIIGLNKILRRTKPNSKI